MMHFADDEGEPGVLINPGRLKLPAWAFMEVGRLRREILQIQKDEGKVDLQKNPQLRQRLDREVVVQNMPFLSVETDPALLQHFVPVKCKLRDLVPLSFYLSHDTYSLPLDLQQDIAPPSHKLLPDWGSPISSRVWATTGPPWKRPYPAWGSESVPQPCEETMIYSCFHCDRMENLHTLLSGEKRVVLVPPGQRDVLRSTRHAKQRQWLVSPVPSPGGGGAYLSHTLFTSTQTECTSDQSAVHPFRSCEENRKVSQGCWPEAVDFPVKTGTLRRGDTLYIPAYHWHWVATSTPATVDRPDEGPLAMSVNWWWWPIHNQSAMEQWSFQNECESWQNSRIPIPEKSPPDREQHLVSFYQLAARQRQDAAVPKPWPSSETAQPKAPPLHGSGNGKTRTPAKLPTVMARDMSFELVD